MPKNAKEQIQKVSSKKKKKYQEAAGAYLEAASSLNTSAPSAGKKQLRKKPPSLLDLSAAFASHFIQVLRTNVPKRICDVFT